MNDRRETWPKLRASFHRCEISLRKILWLMTALVILGSVLSGCSPFYVIRAAYEEGKILWRREPIPQYLEKADLGRDTQDKLKLVLAVRQYAGDVLKLNVGGSYSSYSYVDRPDLSYILTAAPRTELRPYTWWFLIVGRVPYKGYFSRADADAAAEALEAQGYDTNIRTAAAFSTLGWFDDPLLSHLLRYDKVSLAEVIFHELFHNTVYVKGAGAFNESAANFVGGRSAINFFRDRFGESSLEHQRAIRAWEEELEFAEFLETLTNTLSELYARDIPYEDKLRLREEVFSRSKAEWARRVGHRPANRFRSFAQQPLNNAIIINYFLYLKNLKLFEAVYEAEGKNLLRAIDSIREAVAKGGEPFESVQSFLNNKNNRDVVKTGVVGMME
jgi:predicted aminopeptidase